MKRHADFTWTELAKTHYIQGDHFQVEQCVQQLKTLKCVRSISIIASWYVHHNEIIAQEYGIHYATIALELGDDTPLLECAKRHFRREEHHQVEQCVQRLKTFKRGKAIGEIASWYSRHIEDSKDCPFKKYYWIAAKLGDETALEEWIKITKGRPPKRVLQLCLQYGNKYIFRSFAENHWTYPNRSFIAGRVQFFSWYQSAYRQQRRQMEIETLKTILELHPKYPHVPKEIFKTISTFL
jgi:hypothetical protein